MKPITWPARTCAPFEVSVENADRCEYANWLPWRSRIQRRLPGGVVPADGEERAVRDGDDRLAELAEEVDPVLVVRAS